MKHSGTRIFTAVVAPLRAKFELSPAKSATYLIVELAATHIPAPTLAPRPTAPFPPG
jgi:hypothetical protein